MYEAYGAGDPTSASGIDDNASTTKERSLARIAVVGWGSLIWSPRGLSKTTGWRPGPALPVEFARKSADGRVTLALYGDEPVPTFWALSGHDDLAAACENLRRREGNARPGDIHFTTGQGLGTHRDEEPSPETQDVSDLVGRWLGTVPDLDAAVWTGLPPRGFIERERSALATEVVGYLSGLTGDLARKSEEYIRRAPAPVRTPIRAAIEAEPLQWLPEALSPNFFEPHD